MDNLLLFGTRMDMFLLKFLSKCKFSQNIDFLFPNFFIYMGLSRFHLFED